MTRFLVATAGLRPLLALIATHGLTDLDSRKMLLPYGVAIAAPLPSPAVTALFCAASLAHFSKDVGPAGSLAVHTGVAVAGCVWGVQAAFRGVILYLAFIHVPIHYLRCILRGRYRAVLCTALVTLLAMACSPLLQDMVPLTDSMQRFATAHMATEARTETRSTRPTRPL